MTDANDWARYYPNVTKMPKGLQSHDGLVVGDAAVGTAAHGPSASRLPLTNADLERLRPGVFLNDSLIEFGLK